MSATRPDLGTAAVPEGAVAIVEPAGDGTSTAVALLSWGARLAGGLGAALAALTCDAGDEPDVDALCAALADAISACGARVVLLADDGLGRQLAPMLALELGTSAVLGCTDILVRDGEAVYVKPVCGGWLEREFSFAPGCAHVATVEPVVVPAGQGARPEPDFARLDVVPAAAGPGRPPPVTRLELVPPDPRTVDLVDARRIVAAGTGSASDELLAAVAELADLLEGSVGATRPVVDDGRLPKERLIGRTGKTVAPDLYVALGISGSPHHIAGVQDAGRIFAVNRDDHAPIVPFSDASYVGRLEDVLPALLGRIKAWRDGKEGADDRND